MNTDKDVRPADVSEVNSALILRADEMGNELRKLVKEKDKDRAAVLITMDLLDGEQEAEATVMVRGRGYMLVELCRLMWNDPRIGVALKVLLMSEIEKIKLSDEGKRIEARRVLLVHGAGAPGDGAIPIPGVGCLLVRLGRGAVGQTDGRPGGTIYPREGVSATKNEK